MARGTFSHAKLKNVMKGQTKVGPYTIHQPSGVSTTVFDASVKYKEDQVPLIVIGGENFGRGAARDWATKGPYLLGVRAVLAINFSPVYKHNLIKTGIFLSFKYTKHNMPSGLTMYFTYVRVSSGFSKT